MSLVADLLGFQTRSADTSGGALGRWMNWLDTGGSSGPSSAGLWIDQESMYTIAAVYCAIRVLAESGGSISLELWQKMKDGSKGPADNDPTFWTIQKPNSELHQMKYLTTEIGRAACRGNSYTQLIRDGKGRVKEMWPIHPDRTIVKRKGGMLVYEVSPYEPGQSADYVDQSTSGKIEHFFQNSGNMMHFSLFSANGVTGMSPLEYARNTFGLALAQEEYASRLYSNGAMPRGVLTSEDEIQDEEFDAFKEMWDKLHTGIWNAHKTAILPHGVKWQQMALSAEDAQFLLSRKFQLAEIARIFRVPLHMLQELDRSTNNNIEHQSLEFLTYSMRPWLVNWKQTMDSQILTQTQREKGLYFRFKHEELLALDSETQANIARTYVQIGVKSINEAREGIDMNPIEGGDEHYMQGAMAPLDQLDKDLNPDANPDGQQDPNADAPPADDPQAEEDAAAALKKQAKKKAEKAKKQRQNDPITVQQRAIHGFKTLILNEIEQIQRKEAQTISFKAKKLRGAEFTAWLEKFANEQGEDFATRVGARFIVAAEGLIERSEDVDAKLVARAKRISETYSEGIKIGVATLIEASQNSWPLFMQSLEDPKIDQERGQLARQIASNEIHAIFLLGEGDDYATDAA